MWPRTTPKCKVSWHRGPGFGYPQRGFAFLEGQWFIEIPNIKLQISNGSTSSPPWAKSKGNFQWPKFENPNNVSPWKVLVTCREPLGRTIEYWNLKFICNLVLVVWSLFVYWSLEFVILDTKLQGRAKYFWPLRALRETKTIYYIGKPRKRTAYYYQCEVGLIFTLKTWSFGPGQR